MDELFLVSTAKLRVFRSLIPRNIERYQVFQNKHQDFINNEEKYKKLKENYEKCLIFILCLQAKVECNVNCNFY